MLLSTAKLISYKKNKTQINVNFSLPPDVDEVQLIQYLKVNGYLAFNPDEFKKKVEEFMKNRSVGVDEHGKSESQKLRGKIYGLWDEATKRGKTEKTLEQFYTDTMQWLREELIGQLFDKLY